MTRHQMIMDEILADPELRQRLAEALAADLAKHRALTWHDRAVAVLAGLSSAAVVMIAFLIPSAADLWDRYQLRATIDGYAKIGRSLIEQGKYTAAEQAFDRALELAGNGRQDLYIDMLRARIGRVDEDPEWHGKIPEDLTESDFLHLLETQGQAVQASERASTLTAFGTFLAAQHRVSEAERALREAIALDPAAANPHVNMGTLMADAGDTKSAEAEYRHGIKLEPGNASARYDLGVLLAEDGRHADAEEQFRNYTQIEANVADGYVRLAEEIAEQGRVPAARDAYQQALRLDRTNAEAKRGLKELGKAGP